MTTIQRPEPVHVRADLAVAPAHRHTARCHWELRECRWHCPPAPTRVEGDDGC